MSKTVAKTLAFVVIGAMLTVTAVTAMAEVEGEGWAIPPERVVIEDVMIGGEIFRRIYDFEMGTMCTSYGAHGQLSCLPLGQLTVPARQRFAVLCRERSPEPEACPMTRPMTRRGF